MKKNYKFVVFSPYFGKLPVNFNLWLKSCSYNKDFKFIVFTDDKREFEIPDNVEMVYMEFREFKNEMQKAFDFPIALNNPYKLCDFKTTYGYVFSKYLNNCAYWGFCDIDLIFGDIKKFLPKKKYDKISYLGHLCLFRNDKAINEAFMTKMDKTINYIDILSNDYHFGFDEIGNYGINKIFEEKKFTIYNLSQSVADVDCRKERMYIVSYDRKNFSRSNNEKIFIFDNGRIESYDVNKNKIDGEYAYVHFQKRKMINKVNEGNKFIITYNSFVDFIDLDESSIKELLPNDRFDFKWIKFKIYGIKRRIKRHIAIKKIMHRK